ncbi:hypothetical protein EW093_16585 [Thiospirochaeta perfilievii]|uniref:WD40 repeat domain-containing protein n=1 Tax=Thiospirochaeta perfilievii TaxID=252967 RepID=A0A5C1QI73_9SPIO|nr:hypothetical protein [Thiospirochaeta perfilievii]QEN06236.1 hypothetical protein EW093_16585 [Thiospirochaeta perfilievii]
MVRQVFKIPILLFLISCTTVENSKPTIVKTVSFPNSEKFKELLETDIEDTFNGINEKKKVLTSGSISTLKLIDSDLWIGKLGGELLRYNIYTGDLKVFLEDEYTIKDFSIKKIIDNNNKILVLQSDRVLEINKKNDKIYTHIFRNEISRATDIVFHNGILYISTLGYGLWSFDTNNNIFRKINLNDEYISTLFINDNNLYIGSMRQGLYIYNIEKDIFLSRTKLPIQLFNKNILDIKMLNNVFWIGSAKRGLIKWNIEDNSVEVIYPDLSVSSIALSNNIKVVSFIGDGLYVEIENRNYFESIDTFLETNNITSIELYEKNIILGNIKKGVTVQEYNY